MGVGLVALVTGWVFAGVMGLVVALVVRAEVAVVPVTIVCVPVGLFVLELEELTIALPPLAHALAAPLLPYALARLPDAVGAPGPYALGCIGYLAVAGLLYTAASGPLWERALQRKRPG